MGQASEHLPVGLPDPILSGEAALELYTGGLWTSAKLEVLVTNARALVAELFALGFRSNDNPDGQGRGFGVPPSTSRLMSSTGIFCWNSLNVLAC